MESLIMGILLFVVALASRLISFGIAHLIEILLIFILIKLFIIEKELKDCMFIIENKLDDLKK